MPSQMSDLINSARHFGRFVLPSMEFQYSLHWISNGLPGLHNAGGMLMNNVAVRKVST
jgi:hypothetical protein